MSDKHYDINYLQNSRRLLKNLKEDSYNFFREIQEGTVIDLGCGAGNDVTELAGLLGEKVSVLGIDHDPVMLDQAKKNAGSIPNVDFILSEAFPLPFESDSISGLRTERMVQHLTQPEKTIAEVHRILKKDHPLVIMETDWRSLSFYTGLTDIESKVNGYLTDVKVNNGFAARKLTHYLEKANFRNIHFQVYPFVINTLAEAEEYFMINKIAKEAAEKKYISISDSQEFYESLQNADAKEYFSCSINLVIASSIK